MSNAKIVSEDEPGEKWDRCIADALLKTGTGFGLGLTFSLLLFKRRPWPVALGSGFGLGYAMSNCQHDFRRVQSVYLQPIKEKAPEAPAVSKPEAPASEPTVSEQLPTSPAPSNSSKQDS